MNYRSLKKQNEKELSDFVNKNGFRAISLKDYENGMKKYNDVVEVDCGDFIPRTKLDEYNSLKRNQAKRLNEEIVNDRTGENFIYEMCKNELKENGFEYTLNDDVLREWRNNPQIAERMHHGLELAKKSLMW